ncbi:glycosyltransferase [Aliarcobacter skirrowii]|uniref:glycosyltransferase n=1 Tax=Aliarcobacter skirrowii TaxID=28200 RepID=UPI000825C0B1|nr:glycosyltransferase [Aliarcobacter skirrowii]
MNRKITFLINGLRGGGAERICVTLANGFVDKGINVDLIVLSLDGAVRNKDLDSRVKLINLNTKNTRKSFGSIKKYIEINEVKKILVFNFQLAILLVWIRFFIKINFQIISRNISTLSQKSKLETNFWHKYITHFFAKLFYNRVNKLIAQSQGMADDLIENYRCESKKITVINNPINQKIEEYLINNKCTQSAKNNEMLFIGRLEKVKGLEYLFEAFARLKNKEVFLRLIGEGSVEKELKELAKSLNINDRIIFDGYKEDIIPYILKAKVTVLTSLYEGFPNALIESIALGTPVVSFDCQSGPSEIIEDGTNGFLVEYLNVEDLATMLDSALGQEWDEKVIKESAKKYSSDGIVSRYLDVIND